GRTRAGRLEGCTALLDSRAQLTHLSQEGASDMRPTVNFGVKMGAAVLLAVAPIAVTFAQDAPASPEETAQKAVDLRQSLFRVISFNFGPIGGMLKNKVPFDAAVVAKDSARLEALAP